MNRVTMQDIADALGISRITVWKVFNDHPGVSAALRKSVLDKAKEMGYSRGHADYREESVGRNVSLIVSRPDSSTFWTGIIHRLAQDLALRNVNLMYTYMPSVYSDKFRMPSVLANHTVQGAVVLNIYDEKLLRLINELNMPKVFVDVVPQMDLFGLNGDLILLEGYHAVYQITKSILEKGVRRIGFIGDIQYAKTNRDRYDGFCKCLEDYGIPLDAGLCLTGNLGIFSYRQEINCFLDALPKLPEAFVCVSDYIAHFVQAYLLEHAHRAPQGMIVSGFDGDSEHPKEGDVFPTALVRTDLLGGRIAMQIQYRMEHPNAPYELVQINPAILTSRPSVKG